VDITATAWRVESRTRASNMFSIVAAILTLLALAAPLFISRGAVQNLFFILTMLVLAQVPSQDWLKFAGGVISSLSKQTRIGVSAPTEITPWRRIAQCLPQAPPKVNSFSAMIGSIR
jgi:branched-chain amino acid transport system permease protein